MAQSLVSHLKEVKAFFEKNPNGTARIKTKTGEVSYNLAQWKEYLKTALAGRTSRGLVPTGRKSSQVFEADLRRFSRMNGPRNYTRISDIPRSEAKVFLKILEASWMRIYRNGTDETGFQSFSEAKQYATKMGYLKPKAKSTAKK